MLELEQQSREISRHTDASAVHYVIPFNVNTCQFIVSLVQLHTMEFLEDFEEIVEVFNTYIFDAKVVDNEAELDGMPFVVPEVWSQSRFVETFGN